MHKKIFINQQPNTLDPAQLIQSGGEGMVFAVKDTAVKLYHQPTPKRRAKLRHWFTSDLADRLPTNVLAPCTPVTDEQGQLIGFQMPRLPTGSRPLKKLSQPAFWRQINLTTTQVIDLLQDIHATLTKLHRLGIVVGDLNDHNLFFTSGPPLTSAWIDVDSYQFGGFPCPVALPAFLDPTLYGVTDFSQRPYFTPATDWYAFAVLLVKSLLQVHPYGGVHTQHKTPADRAQAGITILDTAVTYPTNARPRAVLSDDMLHHVHKIFGRGDRYPFPADVLTDYCRQLLTCGQCGLGYPRSRTSCPRCRQITHRPAPAGRQIRPLLHTTGFIEHVALSENGRILAIVRAADSYRLVRLGVGGVLEETILFTGRPGYRFGLFRQPGSGEFLAVNPPGGRQLLLLDVSGAPRQVTLIETAPFRETAVFAATPRHLYRIAGAWIMRGSVRHGLYVEDAIATAHRRQTRFWASPYGETLAGYHRILAQRRYFLWHNGAAYDAPVPKLPAGGHLRKTTVGFGPRTVAFVTTIGHGDQAHSVTTVVDHRGQVLWQGAGTAAAHFPFTTDPALAQRPFRTLPLAANLAAATHLYVHPQGVLVREANRLLFAPS